MILVLLDAFLSLIPYLLLALLVPSAFKMLDIPTTPALITHFRKTLAIYAGLILFAWISNSPQLTLFTGIFSLVILARLAHEVLSEMPRPSRERRWLQYSVAGFIGLAVLPILIPLATPFHVVLYWSANLIGSLVLAGAWLRHTNLSAAGKGRLVALAAHTIAIMLITVSFLAWAQFVAS